MTHPTLPEARDYFDREVSHLRDQAERVSGLADALDTVLSGDAVSPAHRLALSTWVAEFPNGGELLALLGSLEALCVRATWPEGSISIDHDHAGCAHGAAVYRDAVLRTLRRARHSLLVSAIASRTGHGQATVRETLLALESEGLASRLDGPSDFWQLTRLSNEHESNA